MKTFNVLVEYNKERECGEIINSKELKSSFTDQDMYQIPDDSKETMVSYVCLNNSIQEAEREAIEYIEELEHQKVQSLTEYMEDRLQCEADIYYLPEEN